ncbi:MAG TPA: PAS domain-containing protein [Steroidobacter sp.]|uniref:GAF domain-containing hybrid sensor histidine kinase/response regulator n=1 Tax=Steroidobacter sp. TaxID=1978227 RepID=UPI002ED84C71
MSTLPVIRVDGSAEFLSGGGEMGELIRAFDWEGTPLGRPQGWPQALRTALRILLTTQHPACVFWGPQLICFYNDSFRSSLGPERHPAMLGAPLREVWSETWSVMGPQIERVMSGAGSTWAEDHLVMIPRFGKREEIYWTYSFSPIDDAGAANNVGGVMVLCMETTKKVRAERQLAFQLALSDKLRSLSDAAEIMLTAAGMVGRELGAGRVGYGEIEESTNTVLVVCDWTLPDMPSLAGRHPLNDFGAGLIRELRMGRILRVEDSRNDPRISEVEETDIYRTIGSRSGIVVPLIKGGRFVAVFYVHQAEPRRWTDNEVALTRETAERTWDAVERARAENALRQLNATLEQRVEDAFAQRKLWSELLDSVTALVAAVGNDYRYLAMNKAYADRFERRIGVRPQVGQSLLEIMKGHREQLALSGSRWSRALAGEEFTLIEPDATSEGDSPRHFEITYTSLRDRDGAVIGAFQYAQDVTERVRDQQRLSEAEESLRQSQKMEAVGQLTGGIAHDFNNLLTGIIGSLDMMQRKLARGRQIDVNAYVSAAMTAANRAAALTHRLLAFSRRQALDPRPVHPNRLIRGIEELLRRTLGETIALELKEEPDLWLTRCDQNQLESALLNLTINARDAMPEGGKLIIQTCNTQLEDPHEAKLRDVVQGDYICICVTDTGVGMTPEVMSRAFDPFFTTKPIGQGTGLGLSMIYGFTRQSGGYAKIQSEVAKGTTVKLYLPRFHGEHQSSQEPERVPVILQPSAREEVVLVVEDEQVVRDLVVDLLTELGYRSLQAADGPSGLAIALSDVRIDLLITDVGLPGFNGRQLADAACAHRPGLKVLFITGYAHSAAVSNDLLSPGMQMITKPFALETLAERIRDLIES